MKLKGPWDWLGIEPTRDVREIKRAYGQAAKKCHPEDAPEEFRLLREAYEAALRFARREWLPRDFMPHTAQAPMRPENVPLPEPPTREGGAQAYDFDTLIADGMAETVAEQERRTDAVIARLEALYNNSRSRKHRQAWAAVAESVTFRSVRDTSVFVKALTRFVQSHPALSDGALHALYCAYRFQKFERRQDREDFEALYRLLQAGEERYMKKARRRNRLAGQLPKWIGRGFFLITVLLFILFCWWQSWGLSALVATIVLLQAAVWRDRVRDRKK